MSDFEHPDANPPAQPPPPMAPPAPMEPPPAPPAFAPLEASAPPAAPLPAMPPPTRNPSAPPPPPLGTGFATRSAPPTLGSSGGGFRQTRSLGTALQLIFAVWVMLAMYGIYTLLEQRSALFAFFDGTGSTRSAIDSDDLVASFAALSLVLQLATIIVFLIWFYRSYNNINPLTGRHPEHSSGWAIGAWFVPFLNWVRPYQMTQEIWEARRYEDTRPTPAKGLLVAWWGALVVASVLLRIITAVLSTNYEESRISEARDRFSALNTSQLIEVSLTAVSAVLAILVVRTITQRQAVQATEASLTV